MGSRNLMATGTECSMAHLRSTFGSPLLGLRDSKQDVRGWMLRYSCSSRGSQCLHIGANDIANPARLSIAVDFVDAGLFPAK